MKKITGKGIPKGWALPGQEGLSYLFLLFVCLIFAHCNDPQEGCLDPKASNYEVSADDPCEDCCEYPTLTISYTHQFDSTVLNTSTIYTNDLGQPFQVHDFSYFLTDFQLISKLDTNETNGTNIVNVIDTDTLQLYSSTETSISVDNFSLVTANTRSDVLGILEGEGTVDSLKFHVGIAVPTRTLQHPTLDTIQQQIELRKKYLLSANPDTIYQIVIETDSLGDPTEILYLMPEELLWGRTHFLYQEITLPYSLNIAKGVDYTISLAINYQKWFKSLDLINHTKGEMLNIILDSIPGSIEIRQ